jgi:3-deoxy-D-manno-octulosonic-acid transferase
MTEPLPLRVYAAAAWLARPVLRLLLLRRVARGKEEADRLAEREGFGPVARGRGPVLWLHGASVGETLALVALIGALRVQRPDLGGVVTTGTVTAARLVGPRLPMGFVHRYAPLDAGPWVARFLDAWRPDLAVRIDSEIWPVTLGLMARRGVPVVLVNGRISAASARRWAWLPRSARYVMAAHVAIAAQDSASLERFAALGAPRDRLSLPGALKAAMDPPEADPVALAAVRRAIGARPVWLAASTHAPEESLALAAHKAAAMPGLVTLIAPRHPERGAAIAAEARAAGLRTARRAAGEDPAGADVYVADTLGEMGLWYRLAPFAFIGGSVAPMGGHNPYEPAALGVGLAAGGDTRNFAEAYGALAAAGALATAEDAAALAAALVAALDPAGGLRPEAAAAAARGRAALAPDPEPLARAAALVLRHLPG